LSGAQPVTADEWKALISSQEGGLVGPVMIVQGRGCPLLTAARRNRRQTCYSLRVFRTRAAQPLIELLRTPVFEGIFNHGFVHVALWRRSPAYCPEGPSAAFGEWPSSTLAAAPGGVFVWPFRAGAWRRPSASKQPRGTSSCADKILSEFRRPANPPRRNSLTSFAASAPLPLAQQRRLRLRIIGNRRRAHGPIAEHGDRRGPASRAQCTSFSTDPRPCRPPLWRLKAEGETVLGRKTETFRL